LGEEGFLKEGMKEKQPAWHQFFGVLSGWGGKEGGRRKIQLNLNGKKRSEFGGPTEGEG